MTILESVPKITAVQFKGLEGLTLPFVSHVIEGEAGDNPLVSSLSISDKDKYFVKAIDGLDPPERDVAIARTASGGRYQGNTPQDREIVVLLGMNPDESAGETYALLRQNLYTMLNTGYDPKVRITLVAGAFGIAYVDAYVSKMPSPIFDKDPVVQITFTCLNYTFRDFETTTYAPDELDLTYPNIYNFGTAETGFQFAVKFTDDMNGWFIKVAEDQSIGMEFDMQFHENDVLAVSTVSGSRYVHWNKRRGKVQNKLSILKSGSEFVQLHPGMNNFIVPTRNKWEWKGKLSFTAQYWGV